MVQDIKGQATILIVDDDEGIRMTLNAMLRRFYKVICVQSGEQALKEAATRHIDVVLLDINLPRMNGIEVLTLIKKTYEDVEVVMFSVVRDTPTIVQAIKLGAYDYIQKDFELDDVLARIERVLEKQRLEKRVRYLDDQIGALTNNDMVVGQSPQMREILDLVYKVARLPATVLITGESGTGKELLARKIHKESNRSRDAFVGLNVAAIPADLIESTLFGHEKGAFTGAVRQVAGKFEMANGGTLFLDEIGELRLDLQTKLLRVIQERELERVGSNKVIKVDVRIIAATNRNLWSAVKEGCFREDLLYRLNVIPMRMPALRERICDLPELIGHFMGKYNSKFNRRMLRFSEEAMGILKSYHWPGNIRELENLVERLVAVCPNTEVTDADIPIEYTYNSLMSGAVPSEEGGHLKKACEGFEKRFLIAALNRYDWNAKLTAERLGVAYSTMKYKLGRFNIQIRDTRNGR